MLLLRPRLSKVDASDPSVAIAPEDGPTSRRVPKALVEDAHYFLSSVHCGVIYFSPPAPGPPPPKYAPLKALETLDPSHHDLINLVLIRSPDRSD